MQNAIKMLAENQGASPDKNKIPHVPNSVHVPPKNHEPDPEKIKVSLIQVEHYFRENNFPLSEAQNFFYYNQGREWTLTDNFPVKDWQALAQKWMLNVPNHKTENSKPGAQQHNIDLSADEDYYEPL